MKLLGWLAIAGLVLATLCSITAFALSGQVGLNAAQRIAFYYAHSNITADQATSAQLLSDAQPLDVAYQATAEEIAADKQQHVPVLLQCEQILASNYPIMVERAQTLQAAVDAVDISPLAPLQSLIDNAASLLGALSTSFDHLGVIENIYSGTFLLTSIYSTQSINMTFELHAMHFPAGAKLYFLHIEANPALLLIDAAGPGPAQIEMSAWTPAVLRPAVGILPPAHTDTILDDQRNKIRVAQPSGYPVTFSQRQYDLDSASIIFIDPVHNFTAGAVVGIVEELTLNVAFV